MITVIEGNVTRHLLKTKAWRGVEVRGVRLMNEVNSRRARLVPGLVTVSGVYTVAVCNRPTRSTQPYVSLGSVTKSSSGFGWGKGGNVINVYML